MIDCRILWRTFLLFPFGLLLIGASGCASPLFGPWYGVGLYNGTKVKLDDADVKGFNGGVVGGIMVPHANKTTAIFIDPLPQTAKVIWRTPDGKLHEQEVAVAALASNPKHFKGMLMLEIRTPAVMAYAVPDSAWEKYAVERQRRDAETDAP